MAAEAAEGSEAEVMVVKVLHPDARTLGDLLSRDDELQRREMELGYRVNDPTGQHSSDRLWEFLEERHIPVPVHDGDFTKTQLPVTNALDILLEAVGCGKQ